MALDDNVIDLERYRSLVAQREKIPKAKYFMEIWKIHYTLLSPEKKEQIESVYLRQIVGIDDTIIDAYRRREVEALGIVERREALITPSPSTLASFWEKVAEIALLYSIEDVAWLKRCADPNFPWIMKFYLEKGEKQLRRE